MMRYLSQNVWLILVSWYLVSTAVSALPKPSGQNHLYVWFYSFSHTIAGNLPAIIHQAREKTKSI